MELSERVAKLLVCVIELSACSILCVLSMRERLRLPLLWSALAILLAELLCLVVCYITLWPPIVYAPLGFLIACLLVRARFIKVTMMYAIILNYLLCLHSLWQIAWYGSSREWSILLLFLLTVVSMPPMVWVLRERFWPILNELQNTEIRILLPLPLGIIVVFVLLTFSYPFTSLGEERTFVLLVLLLGFLSYQGYHLVLSLLSRNEETMTYRQHLRAVDIQLQQQTEHYQQLAQQVHETRQVRHDMRQHLRILGQLLEEGEIAQAKDYLTRYGDTLHHTLQPPLSEHLVVDALLQGYRQQAVQLDIRMSLGIALPAQVAVEDIDLCIVLGNLLENALAACTRQQGGERFVEVGIRTTGEEVQIVVSNSFDLDADKERMKIRRHQGLGIPAVHAIARKYGGVASFEEEGTVFRAYALLYLQKRRNRVSEEAISG